MTPPASDRRKGGQPMTDKREIRILVIDDDLECGELLGMQLAAEGYAAEVAEDAVEGGKAILERPPNLILCDVNMPHMNGLELVALLRKDKRTASIPVIFIAGRNDTETIAEAVALGAVDFLAKPITHAELLASVEACLRGGRRPYAPEVGFPPVV